MSPRSRKQQQVEVPRVQVPKHGFGDQRRPEAFMTRGLHQPLARESMERVPDGRYAGVELFGQHSGLKAVAATSSSGQMQL